MEELYGSYCGRSRRALSDAALDDALRSCSSAEGGNSILSPGNVRDLDAAVTVYCADHFSAGAGDSVMVVACSQTIEAGGDEVVLLPAER